MKSRRVFVVVLVSWLIVIGSRSNQSSAGERVPAKKNKLSEREAAGIIWSSLFGAALKENKDSIEAALKEKIQKFCNELDARTAMEKALLNLVVSRDMRPNEEGAIITVSLIQASETDQRPASTRSARLYESCLVVYTKCSTASVAKTTAVVSYAAFGKGQVYGELERLAYDRKAGWQAIKCGE